MDDRDDRSHNDQAYRLTHAAKRFLLVPAIKAGILHTTIQLS